MKPTLFGLVILITLLGCTESVTQTPQLTILSSEKDFEISLGDTIQLNGTSNLQSVRWRLTKKPMASITSINDSLNKSTYLIPDTPGQYVISLVGSESGKMYTDSISVDVFIQTFVGSILDLDFPNILECPNGDCSVNSLLRRGQSSFLNKSYATAPVEGTYIIQGALNTETFRVKATSPTFPEDSRFQKIMQEDFNQIDESWKKEIRCCYQFDSYYHYDTIPQGASLNPAIESSDGVTTLYSGSGDVSLAKSLPLELENHRYIKIVIDILQFTRSWAAYIDGSAYTEFLIACEFEIKLGAKKITPRIFPAYYNPYWTPDIAGCAPMKSISNSKITFIYDSKLNAMVVHFGNDSTNFAANFLLIDNDDTFGLAFKSSSTNWYYHDPDRHYSTFYVNTFSIDGIEVKASN